jgi:hypothetical protein
VVRHGHDTPRFVLLDSGLTTISSDTGDINPLPPHLVLTKSTTDLHFHIVGPLATSNEVQLSLALNAFNDAVSLLLRGQVEKRSVLEGLDMVLLAADETIDDGSVSVPLGHPVLSSHPANTLIPHGMPPSLTIRWKPAPTSPPGAQRLQSLA